MGTFLSGLFSGGIEGAGKGIAAVINSIKGKSPEDAAKLQQLLEETNQLRIKYDAEFMQAQINENIQLNQTAGQNIQAEAKGDWFSRDARPAVIWVGLVILAWNYMVVPLVGIKYGITPVNFPDMFWWTWGVVATGYVFARSGDKLFGGPGGSLQGPFGIKAESKGD